MRYEFYLSLGSNVGDRVRNLEGVLIFLAELPETAVSGTSSYYETKPVGFTQQRNFLNRVVRVTTGLSPQALKTETRRIEDYYGRDRSLRWGPRAVDIDLLWADGIEVAEPDLIIPHPRMWERAFVLVPLAELAPNLLGPDGQSVAQIAAAFDLREEGVQLYQPSPAELDLDRPFPGVVLAGLDPEELGQPLLYKLEVSSTNDVLKDLALEGALEGTAVVAETQFKGKGRQGRSWVSRPFAGLWTSILLRPGIKPNMVPSMTIVGALALARAVNSFAPKQAEPALLKWPNDLLVGGAKVAGCLAEAGVQGGKLSYVILGTGVNLRHCEDELPDLEQPITSLYLAWGKQVSRQALLRTYFTELTVIYQDYLKHGLERLLSEYQSLSCTLGQQVEVRGQETIIGQAIAVTPAGSLLVETPGGVIREVFASEVSVRNVC